MSAVISEAIRNRRLLEIDYAPGRRIVEPHAYGIGSDGQELLRCFQVEGASASNEPQNWKLMRVDRMGGVVDTGLPFSGPRPAYKRDDSAMKRGVVTQL